MQGLYTTHERAAARTPGLDGRDEEFSSTMAELLALPTVAEIDNSARTVEALRNLGQRRDGNRTIVTVTLTPGETALLTLDRSAAAAPESTPSRPWKDLPDVGPEVSGVAEYTATLRLEQDPDEGNRYVLDLGSTAGGLGSIRVNDGATKGFATSRPVVDVTEDLHAPGS